MKKFNWRIIEVDAGDLTHVIATDDKTVSMANCFYKEKCVCACVVKKPSFFYRFFFNEKFEDKMFKKITCCKKWLERKEKEKKEIDERIIKIKNDMRV